MKAVWFTIAYGCCSLSLFAQSFSPGGVEKPAYWFVTGSTAGATPTFLNKGTNTTSPKFEGKSLKVATFNFNPALIFNRNNFVLLPVRSSFRNSGSFFSVYQSFDTAFESSIWHLRAGDTTQVVVTTDRAADLSSYAYMNFNQRVRSHPKLNIYIQQKPETMPDVTGMVWQIGNRPVNPILPIKEFEGLLPEIIAYDRVLSASERLRVGSYLALKYGITLTEPSAEYLSSSGKIIWQGRDYKNFHHNIAGIGRDDASAFLQPRASSSNQANLLTIGSTDSLNNESFLLWGDNDQDMSEEENTEAGVPLALRKKWLMVSSNGTNPFKTNVQLDTRQIDIDPLKKVVYWLAIDRTGKKQFSAGETEYFRMQQIDTSGRAIFQNVIWNKSGSSRESMCIIPGGELLVSCNITAPSCKRQEKGAIVLRVHGGVPPYSIEVAGAAVNILKNVTTSAHTAIPVYNVIAGKVIVKVRDAVANTYTDSFYVNHGDGPPPAFLQSRYVIPASGALTLDASVAMPAGVTYQWSGPASFNSYGAAVALNNPGNYQLTTTYNGCSYYQEIYIVSTNTNLSPASVTIYPNPSTGLFSAAVSLHLPAQVTMSIYYGNGQLLHSEKKNGLSHYRFTHRLTQNGTYRIAFASGQESVVRSLIVVK